MAVKKVQPEVNIGLVGHVDHGKTTLTEKLSGKWTDTHSEELKRGITIRLGYADVSLRKCKECKGTNSFTTNETCPEHKSKTELLRKISFIDAPGHESLMATMLAGSTIMDGALLLIAANERCPQPQTREHLMALNIVGIKNVIIVQNKIDLVSLEEAQENHKQIKEFLKQTDYKDAPIIPISAQHNVNLDALIEAIQKYVPTPKRDNKKEPLLLIARSFDINKPGTSPKEIKGGVLGGALKQGVLKVGEDIEIKPGIKVEESNQTKWKPLMTKIIGLTTGGNSVKDVGPGGSVGIMTSLDPNIVRSDQLAGSLVGIPGKLPETLYSLKLKTFLLKRVVGSEENITVDAIKNGEMLMLNINAASTIGIVTDLGKDSFACNLKLPVCAKKGERVTLSRRVGSRFRLIGYGEIA